MSRLLKALQLEINEPLTVKYNNQQTIHLLVEEAA
jgi:hypothetical protein